MMRVDEVLEARSLQEALTYKQKHRDYRWICGGTDVVPALRDGVELYKNLIDINHLNSSLNYIELKNNALHIGSLTKHAAIAENKVVREVFPAFARACGCIGSAQIRTRATIAGNLANASPAADSAPTLLAAGAILHYQSSKEESQIPIADFFLGPRKTSLPGDALLTEIEVPVPEGGWQGDYYKVGARTALTIAIASVAVLYSKETGYKVAYGSVGPTVLAGTETKIVLDKGCRNKRILKEAVNKDICPIDDVRASAAYRRQVCLNLVWLALQK